MGVPFEQLLVDVVRHTGKKIESAAMSAKASLKESNKIKKEYEDKIKSEQKSILEAYCKSLLELFELYEDYEQETEENPDTDNDPLILDEFFLDEWDNAKQLFLEHKAAFSKNLRNCHEEIDKFVEYNKQIDKSSSHNKQIEDKDNDKYGKGSVLFQLLQNAKAAVIQELQKLQ